MNDNTALSRRLNNNFLTNVIVQRAERKRSNNEVKYEVSLASTNHRSHAQESPKRRSTTETHLSNIGNSGAWKSFAHHLHSTKQYANTDAN